MFNRSYINGHKNHPHYLSDTQLVSLKKGNKLLEDDEKLLRVIKNLSDPTKLKIYLALKKFKEITVSDLTFLLGVSQSAVSHALSDLKNSGLVDCHRCGKLICYFIRKPKVNGRVIKFLNELIRN